MKARVRIHNQDTYVDIVKWNYHTVIVKHPEKGYVIKRHIRKHNLVVDNVRYYNRDYNSMGYVG